MLKSKDNIQENLQTRLDVELTGNKVNIEELIKGKTVVTAPHDLELIKIESEEICQTIDRFTFDPKCWIDCDTYWLNKSEQGSNNWKNIRKYRLTASNFGGAIGKSSFCTPEGIVTDITSAKEKIFSEKSKYVMQHGIDTEPKAREWYCKNKNVEVVEVGLAVPKWEPRIGASLDGEIKGTDGMIEIKSPLLMYEPIKTHMSKINGGWEPPKFYHEHIWDSHYCQMQGGMKITGKKWCDYIIYATKSNLIYVERIYFDEEYWNKILYPGILYFLDNLLEPVVKKNNLFTNI